MTADELWRRFRASGDAAALGALFDAVSPGLFRIALSLAPDAASAEDALQETWLVALRSAERHDAARPVVPWLAGILRRKVHEARRRTRRPDERRVARRPAPDDPAELAQSREETTRMRAALDELPASCREVAVLRWRYGLEPAEIADARGLPPGTVRSLLHRALARMKRRMKSAPALFLGARWPRGLDGVRAAVLRAAARRSAIDAALASAGGLVMAKATKTAAIAAIACLLLGAGAAVRLAGRGEPMAASSPAGEPSSATRTTPRARLGAPDAASAAPAVESAKPFARGIVVDEAGAPIAGCRVLVRGHETIGDDVQEAPTDLAATAAATTGADGRFVMPRRPGDLAALVFVADGFAVAEVHHPTEDLRVVLSRCKPLAGRVEDTAGRPIERAEVQLGAPLVRGDTSRREWLAARTGADGRFEFRSTPREYLVTWVGAKGYAPAPNPFGSVEPAEVYVLRRSCVVVDVTDAATSRPLGAAHGLLLRDGQPPWPDWRWPAGGGADRDDQPGRLLWSPHPQGRGVTGEMRVFAPGFRTRAFPISFADDAEPPLLRVALEQGDEPAVVAGRIADGAGARVELRVAATTADGRPIWYGSDLQLPVANSTVAAGGGAFALAGVPPGRYRLVVSRDGDAPLLLDVEAPATALDLRFPPRSSFSVRYADTSGLPVAGAWIHVQTADERLSWDVKTDADGVARFESVPAGEVVVLAAVRGVVQLQRFGGMAAVQPIPGERVTLAAGAPTHVDLVRPDRCRVTVVVRDEDGRPLPEVEVHAAVEGGLARFDRDEERRIQSLAPTTDADGRVAFDVLPCRGVVKALRQGRVNSARFTADAGSSPTVEILLPSVTGIVRGRVLERGTGLPVAARPVKVFWDHKVIAESATADDGRFTASGVPAGRVTVLVEGYADANDPQGRRVDPKSPYGSAETEFDMAAGEDRTVAFTMARIKGKDAERPATSIDVTVVDDAGAAVATAWLDVKGLVDGAWCSLGDLRSDAAGCAHLDVVAAERYVIRARAEGSSYRVGEKVVNPPQVSVERDPAPSLVERLVLVAK